MQIIDSLARIHFVDSNGWLALSMWASLREPQNSLSVSPDCHRPLIVKAANENPLSITLSMQPEMVPFLLPNTIEYENGSATTCETQRYEKVLK